MTTRRTWVWLVAGAWTFATVIIPPVAAQTPRRVGFAQVGAESDWRAAETKSIRGEAEKRGVELKFSDGQGKQENQIKAIRSFIAQRLDAIILAPVVETGWEPVLKEARAAKIPVFLVDRGINVSDDSLYVTLIASDFVEEGRMAGRWLVEKTGGQARIVELQGTVGSAPANDRKRGFEEAIRAHPGMRIVRSQSGDFRRSGGKQVMEAFIQALGREFDAVYAHNEDMALGAIQALDADSAGACGQGAGTLSIRRHAPIRTASAMRTGRSARETGLSVSGSTISMYSISAGPASRIFCRMSEISAETSLSPRVMRSLALNSAALRLRAWTRCGGVRYALRLESATPSASRTVGQGMISIGRFRSRTTRRTT